MQYEQNLPFYTENFRQYPWMVKGSDHYVFHVAKGSLAERDIGDIIARQERAYKKITSKLQLMPSERKISYYLYETRADKHKLMGDDWYGQAVYNDYAVHAVYNEEDKVIGEHEDTHLLSLELGCPISLFQEGLAEFMVGHSMLGNSHDDIIRAGAKRGLPIGIENLMSQQGWLDTPDSEAEFYYSLAGSFIAYVTDRLGLPMFKRVYKILDRGNTKDTNIALFEEATGEKINEIEQVWKMRILQN